MSFWELRMASIDNWANWAAITKSTGGFKQPDVSPCRCLCTHMQLIGNNLLLKNIDFKKAKVMIKDHDILTYVTQMGVWGRSVVTVHCGPCNPTPPRGVEAISAPSASASYTMLSARPRAAAAVKAPSLVPLLSILIAGWVTHAEQGGAKGQKKCIKIKNI